MKPENLKGVVHSDPQILGGTPVFVGTRVPLQNLTKFDLAVIMLHPRSTGCWIPFRSCRRSSKHWKL